MSGYKWAVGGLIAVGLLALSAGDAAAQYYGRGPGYSRSYVTPSGGIVTKSYTPGVVGPGYGYGRGYYAPSYGYNRGFYPGYYSHPGYVYPGYGRGFYGPGYGYSTGGFNYYGRGFSVGVGFGNW